MCITRVHIDLREMREICIEFERTGFNVAHLRQELIAREGEDLKALTLVLLVQLRVVLVAVFRRASQCRNVGDHQHFPSVNSQRHFLVVQIVDFKIVHRGGRLVQPELLA